MVSMLFFTPSIQDYIPSRHAHATENPFNAIQTQASAILAITPVYYLLAGRDEDPR